MKDCKLLILFLGCACAANVFGQVLKGRIISSDSKALSYANIGIVGSDIGVVCNEWGRFELNIVAFEDDDSLRISSVGYEKKVIRVREINFSDSLIVSLNESVISLPEITVFEKAEKLKSFGSTSVSGFMNTGWARGSYGGERGVKISSRSKLAVHELRYHIAVNNYDSVLLRLRIRKLKAGVPDFDNEFLNTNIFMVVKNKQIGWRTHDLRANNIVINGDAAVTLELIKYWGKCTAGECFHISMAVPGKTFYSKHRSFSEWTVKKGRSPSLYLIAARLQRD